MLPKLILRKGNCLVLYQNNPPPYGSVVEGVSNTQAQTNYRQHVTGQQFAGQKQC